MTATNNVKCPIQLPPVTGLLDQDLDTVPLELTVTTSITSLTPSDISPALSSRSTTPATNQTTANNSPRHDGVSVGTLSNVGLDNVQRHRNQKKPTNLAHSKSDLEISDNEIKPGARFLSFNDFERVFEHWKSTNFHPFRVASSETLRFPDGSTNNLFKYRYIVYHCAHYGLPRRRGAGKRPNQNYMPCGCKAMLRLNFSWSENILRVTTLNEFHIGHRASVDAFFKFASKIKPRQSSVSPTTVVMNADGQPIQQNLVPAPKRTRSKSPHVLKAESNVVHQQSMKTMKNGHQMKNGPQVQSEGPLNLSKDGSVSEDGELVPLTGPPSTVPQFQLKTVPLLPSAPALSVLMLNQQHQQRQQQQNHHQRAYQELVRLLSVNVASPNGDLVTALGTRELRDCRTDSDRHRLIYPIMQALTQQLAAARGYEFDEKLHDLKSVLKKWQFISTPPTSMSTQYVPPPRSASAAAAAAAMMVQAMSESAGTAFINATNGNGICPTMGATVTVRNGACPTIGAPVVNRNGACPTIGAPVVNRNGACPTIGAPVVNRNGACPTIGAPMINGHNPTSNGY